MKIRLLNDNPYGYRVDISTPEVAELYARFKKWKNIPSWCPLSDNERLEFESYILRQIEETMVIFSAGKDDKNE